MEISRMLADVREYEEKTGAAIRPEMRPKFHLSSRVGWLNDPNGFSWYKGQYHLFYQYHPYDTVWGPMHWGHAVSKDLLHWEYLPAALAPDMPYDQDGCFSGSAIVLPDGRHMLFYTGVQIQKEDPSSRTKEEIQRQCIAVGDGVNYQKYEGNPILSFEDQPEGGSLYDFRDPKVWQAEDGSYRMITCCASPDRDGRIVLFSSKDAIHWGKGSVLIQNNDRFGKVWECPEFFRLGNKWVLLTSPMDMLPEGFEYHTGNGTLCLIGDYDEETGVFIPQHDQAIDYGIDFYATQTVVTPDGRRVMIAWMQNWDTAPAYRIEPTSWFGQMTLPRELSIRNGRLYESPIRELETLRHNKIAYRNVYVNGNTRLDGVKGRCIDLEITVRPADTADVYNSFAIHFAEGGRYYTTLSFHPRDGIVKIDRKFSGSRRAIIHQRRTLLNKKSDTLKLRLILDRFSAEVFLNDGEQVITANLYTDPSAEGISFFSEGSVSMDVVKYDL